MIIIRKVLCLLVFSIICGTSIAQQEYQFSQVTKSVEFLNPAYNVSKKGANATLLHRNQWMGIEGAPKTVALNLHLPMKSIPLGIGASAVGEYVGLRKVLNAGLTANSQVKLGGGGYLAGGLAAGAQITRYNDDKAIAYTEYSELSGYESADPYTGLGVYYFSKLFHAGLAAYYTIAQAKTDVFTENLNVNFNASVVLPLSDKWSLKPYTLVKYSTKYLNSAEGGAMLLWDDFVWLGAGYRYNSAVSAMLDVKIIDYLRIGYSYDYGIGTVSALKASSHEIRLSFEMFKPAAPEQQQIKFR